MKALAHLFSMRRQTWILLGGCLLSSLGALGTVMATWSSRDVAIHEWEQRLASVARMLTAHAGQSVGAADLVLRSMTDNVNEYRVRNEDELRWVFGSQQIFEMLKDGAKGVPQVEVVAVAALDGSLINFTRQYPPPSLNFEERDYFQAHIADPALDVFMSAPLQNRSNGEWTIFLSRKIRSPSGDMLGLVLIGLKADFFSDFYKSVGPGLSAVSLLRSDGVVLSRYPVEDGVVGTSMGDTFEFKTALADTTAATAFLLEGRRGSSRRFTQIVAMEKSADFPLVISVSARSDLILRDWEGQAVKFVLEGGAMTGILMAATMLVVRLVAKLENARLDAMRAVDAKTRFAETVSHELRTPMNSIIGGTHQLLETELSPESQKYAALVSLSAQHLLVLINDVLDFAYYKEGQFKIEIAPFDVRQLASNSVEMASSVRSRGEIFIHGIVDDDVPPMLLGDSGRITQVLLNLLTNGVKYTDAGSVTLRVGYDHGGADDGVLRMTVTDTGFGIALADQTRIFEAFERGRALGADRSGTGLGLTISKKLIEVMKGAIRLESKLGTGSSFHVELPMPTADVKPADMLLAPELPAMPDALRILIAEDVAPSRMLLEIMLQKMGHSVVAVANGREAVDCVRSHDFDLVLMDIQMPEMDGHEATRLIRQMPGIKGRVCVIAVSANCDVEIAETFTRAGFDDTLVKPLKLARMKFIIDQLMRQGRIA